VRADCPGTVISNKGKNERFTPKVHAHRLCASYEESLQIQSYSSALLNGTKAMYWVSVDLAMAQPSQGESRKTPGFCF